MPRHNYASISPFVWTKRRQEAVLLLAQGFSQEETALELGLSRRTIQIWLNVVEFAAERDRLSLMVDIAGRAYRLRYAMNIVRSLKDKTSKDPLDWLKYAQSETDGVKLDLATLADAAISLANSGQGGDDKKDGTDKDTEGPGI